MKKLVSVFLTIALMISGMVFTAIPVQAAGIDYTVRVGESINISSPKSGYEYAWWTDTEGHEFFQVTNEYSSTCTITGLKAGERGLKVNVVFKKILFDMQGKPYEVPETTQYSFYITVLDNSSTANTSNNNNSSVGSSGDFVIENGVLTKYNGTSVNVVIPDGVTEIGERAFYKPNFASNLKSVTIPGSVKKINKSAFVVCTRLTDVTIDYGLETIGEAAFSSCTGLKKIVLPNSVKTISRSAFDGCKNLTEVTIPPSVTSIGIGAFTGCNYWEDKVRKLGLWDPVTIYGKKGSYAETYAKEYAEMFDTKYTKNSKVFIETNTFIEKPADTTTSNPIAGNTSGNLINDGFVTESNGGIYLKNSDGYLARENDKTAQIITKDTPYYINVIGDWIYYSNNSDNNKLYKIKTDGTKRTKISDNRCNELNVAENWIYYVNKSDNSKLYKIKTDGTGNTRINDDWCFSVNIIGDWIYYGIGNDKTMMLYKIKTDGTSRTKISNDANVWKMIISGDWVYYLSLAENKLYKIKADGTGNTKISNDKCYFFNTDGDWIYYSMLTGDKGLYKIKTDGTGKTKLVDGTISAIFLTKDWIYYSATENFKSVMYRIPHK